MGNSDTDTESECFESAEESLDEEGDGEIKNLKTKSRKKSESEVVEPVPRCDNVDSGTPVEKEVGGNLSYRKRPERVKRSLSNTATKPIPRTPSNEFIFKPDKIVPDAFFQDITSNLSKNINKSLSTLQQKSSNVKDMILSSLPVPSVNDSERFVYDDNSVQDLAEESEPSASKPESQTHNFSEVNKSINKQKPKIQENSSGEEKPQETKITTLGLLSENGKERKPPDIKEDGLETELLDNHRSLEANIFDNRKKEVSNNEVDEKEFSDSKPVINEKEEESKEMEVLSESIKEDIKQCSVKEKDMQQSSDTEKDMQQSSGTEKDMQQSSGTEKDMQQSSGTEKDMQQFYNEEEDMLQSNNKEGTGQIDNTLEKSFNETSSNSTSKTKSVDDSSNKKSEISQSVVTELIQTDIDDLDACQPKTPTASEELSQTSSINISLSESEKIQEVEVNKDLSKNINSEHTKAESGCNLEELKTALENIVKLEKSIENEVTETQPGKEDVQKKQEKVDEINENSNDGWDDFDFSDNEIENITVTGNNPVKDMDAKVTTSVGSKTLVTKEKMHSGNSKNTNLQQVCESKNSTNLLKKAQIECDSNKEEKHTGNIETEAVAVDNWDWDAWDETPEAPKLTTTATGKETTGKTKETSSDLSKWSGWDTFGTKPQEKQGSWGLGSWGVDVLINKATAVTQGISNVLEAGLGAPDPETLARMEKLEREKLKEHHPEDDQEHPPETPKKNSLTNVNLFPVSGITSLVAGVTSKIVEHSKIQEIGSKVITGGLDTLETFGKKTMEVLQEGDPGLRNKRALLMGNHKPVLSQVLKEARDKAESEMKKAEEKEMAKKCHFETLFDDFQGMVHLEALEMLSRQCELKLEQIRSGMNSEEQEDLNGILEEVEQLCALDEYEDVKSSMLDFKTNLQMAVEPLKNEISVQKIIQIHENVNKWLAMSSETKPSLILINQKLVSTLAELAAATVHQFHKSGELLSVKECRKTVEEVDALSRLTNILCTEISTLCNKFILLSRSKNATQMSDDNLNSISEKVSTILKNSTSYIRQAFDLLVPVIQLGAAV